MKILVIQLARLGDIYMSWPALRALRRTYPSAHIHLLTRSKFEGAVEGLTVIDQHLTLPTGSLLLPLVQEEPNVEHALLGVKVFTEKLKNEKYDWIINLTFSPASSFLTHAISNGDARVTGYSRHADGSLKLCDDMTAYFYAQVGIDKPNRVHLIDIFASMVDLEYTEQDWAAPDIKDNHDLALPDRYMVLHVGASEKQKALSAQSWIQVLKAIYKNNVHLPLVMIGADNEKFLADEIATHVSKFTGAEFVNLVGKTKIADLFTVLKKAELLIGCDSAPIHMASLTDTPTFNVSIGTVNYWETGPKSTLAFIYRAESEVLLNPERLGQVVALLIQGELAPELIVRSAGLASYAKTENSQQSFQWELIKAIYLGGNYPLAETMDIVQGAEELTQVNNFCIDQIAMVPGKGLEFIGPLLDRADEVIHNIGHLVPHLRPLVNWYQAEKVKIGPGSTEEICLAATAVHQRLARHLQAYVINEDLKVSP